MSRLVWKIQLTTALVFILLNAPINAFEFTEQELNFNAGFYSKALKSTVDKDLIVGYLIAKQTSQHAIAEQIYRQATKVGVRHPLWLDQTIKQCLFVTPKNGCELDQSLSQLEQFASSNALVDLYSALNASNNAQLDYALRALQLAASKPEYDDLYYQRFAILLEVMQAHHYPANHLHNAAIKYAHTLVMEPYQALMTLCKSQSANSNDWKKACIDIGKLLVAKGNIFFANMVGFAVQRQALSHDPADADQLAKVNQQREHLNQWRIHAVNTLDFIDGQKRAPDAYYEDLIEFGERIAVENALRLVE